MSLVEDLEAAEKRAGGPPCKACVFLNTMKASVEREAVRDAMAGNIGVNKLADIFRQHGIPVARRAIETHRAHLRETA